MPATVRYDEQYCPIARALDVLGDRWTLLILRELTIGDQRFTDLRDHLPGIAPTMLTQRLRTLTEQGMIATKELPPPAARSVYTITAKGRTVVPVLRALTRWGFPLLDSPDEHTRVRPWTAVQAAVSAFYDEVVALDLDERYLLRVDGEEFMLSSVRGGGDHHAVPDLVIEAPAKTFIDLRLGHITMAEAAASGALVVQGSDTALTNFGARFPTVIAGVERLKELSRWSRPNR